MSIAMLKCPICNDTVQIYGVDDNPQEGISIECDNKDCNYGFFISTTLLVDGLKEEITKNAHNQLCELIAKGKINA